MTIKKTENYTILLFVLISLIVALALLVLLNPILKIDIFISLKIQEISSDVFQKLLWLISDMGNQPFVEILILIISLLLIYFKKTKEALFSSVSAGIGVLFGSLLKIIVNRPRPTDSLVSVSSVLTDKSFPSGHVLVFTIYFGFLLYLLLSVAKKGILRKIISLLLFLLIVLIGISRIYLGVHWPSDVLGGYLLGSLWLLITIRTYNSFNGKR